MTFQSILGGPQRQFNLTRVLLVNAFLAVSIFRPTQIEQGVTPEYYWANKVLWYHNLDVVIGGDSRTYRGVAPSELNKILPLSRIGNYGFSSCAFYADYNHRLEGVLDPTSTRKVVILGVTPSSLTVEASKNNGFKDYARQPWADLWLQKAFAPLLHQFRSNSVDEVPGFVQTFYSDGWDASTRNETDIEGNLSETRSRFARCQVSASMEADLVNQVVAWKEKSIEVVAFRPPSCPPMRDLEDSISGFNEDQFALEIRRAGATWLDFSETYESYDGSHLSAGAALRFSRDLASKLITK